MFRFPFLKIIVIVSLFVRGGRTGTTPGPTTPAPSTPHPSTPNPGTPQPSTPMPSTPQPTTPNPSLTTTTTQSPTVITSATTSGDGNGNGNGNGNSGGTTLPSGSTQITTQQPGGSTTPVYPTTTTPAPQTTRPAPRPVCRNTYVDSIAGYENYYRECVNGQWVLRLCTHGSLFDIDYGACVPYWYYYGVYMLLGSAFDFF